MTDNWRSLRDILPQANDPDAFLRFMQAYGGESGTKVTIEVDLPASDVWRRDPSLCAREYLQQVLAPLPVGDPEFAWALANVMLGAVHDLASGLDQEQKARLRSAWERRREGLAE